MPSLARVSWAAVLGVGLAPRPVLADNLGAIGQALGLLVFAGLFVVGHLILFTVLAVWLRRADRRPGPRTGRILVPLTRILAAAWGVLSLSPIVYNLTTATPLGHDLGWVVLLCLGGGAPAHAAAIVALVFARKVSMAKRSH